MRQDIFGQPVDLPSERAVAEWNAAVLGFLAHAAVTPKHLGACLQAAPDFALGHATKGLFFYLLGRRELLAPAAEALAVAKTGFENDTRTRAMVAALAACLDGQPTRAVARLNEWLLRTPEDALILKLDHALRFVLGDISGMVAGMEQVASAYDADHVAAGYVLGCRAFVLEEIGEFGAAHRTGRQALELAPDDAWGLHAVAHVYDMTCDAAGGLEWLEGRETAWTHCNNFRYHVWWHKALMLLELGRMDEVLTLYDQEIRADRTDDYRDIANAASLLSRLDLEGVAVGDRWIELADLAEGRTGDGCLIFADLHYLLCLIGDRRGSAMHQLLARMKGDANRSGDLSARMARPGLSAARGLEAFGAGDYATAFRNLASARASMQVVGGSRAQRDVFERLTIDAGIRAGEWQAAERILVDRTSQRGGHEDGYAAARLSLIANGRIMT